MSKSCKWLKKLWLACWLRKLHTTALYTVIGGFVLRKLEKAVIPLHDVTVCWIMRSTYNFKISFWLWQFTVERVDTLCNFIALKPCMGLLIITTRWLHSLTFKFLYSTVFCRNSWNNNLNDTNTCFYCTATVWHLI